MSTDRLHIAKDRLVDMPMIADRLGVPSNRVRQWKSSGNLPGGNPFPEPLFVLTQTPVYDWKDFDGLEA